MSDHTQAPWVVEEDWTAELKGADGSLIAKFIYPEKLKDARLCAAAPDLLIAGQRMIDDYQTSAVHHPHHVLISIGAFKAMKDAVTKATGGGDGR